MPNNSSTSKFANTHCTYVATTLLLALCIGCAPANPPQVSTAPPAQSIPVASPAPLATPAPMPAPIATEPEPTSPVPEDPAETTPAEPEPPAKIDLLRKINIKTDVKLGRASRNNWKVTTDDTKTRTLVSIPYELPKDYDLHLVVTRKAGIDGFMVGLTMAGEPCMLTIDGWPSNGGPWTTIGQVDNKGPLNAGFAGARINGTFLLPDQPTRLLVQVRGKEYQLYVDDAPVLAGDLSGFTLSRQSNYAGNYDPYPFIASYQSQFYIEEVSLTLPGTQPPN